MGKCSLRHRDNPLRLLQRLDAARGIGRKGAEFSSRRMPALHKVWSAAYLIRRYFHMHLTLTKMCLHRGRCQCLGSAPLQLKATTRKKCMVCTTPQLCNDISRKTVLKNTLLSCFLCRRDLPLQVYPCVSPLQVYPGYSETGALQQFEQAAQVLGRQGLTLAGMVGKFKIACLSHNQQAAFSTALLQCLTPMAHQLQCIRELGLKYFKFTHASLSELASLFPQVSLLELETVYFCSPLGLPDLLDYLPLLKCVDFYWKIRDNVYILSDEGVRGVRREEIMAFLRTAHEAGRDFTVNFEFKYPLMHNWE